MQDPDLANNLVAVLLHFRKFCVAHSSSGYTRNVLSRFLWWPNGEVKQQPEIYRMTVHLFRATSSPSCAAFALRQVAIDYRPEIEPYVTSAVEKNFYVDNCSYKRNGN